MFNHSWHHVDETVTSMRGKSLETFEECRKAHLKSVLPNYSYAEAQYNYLMNNIRLPEGVQVRDMNDQIEALSPLMSLLPRIWEDPNPSYQNDNPNCRDLLALELQQLLNDFNAERKTKGQQSGKSDKGGKNGGGKGAASSNGGGQPKKPPKNFFTVTVKAKKITSNSHTWMSSQACLRHCTKSA
eukprot:scaffold391_cov157-Skeletonema_menzelii.AAC.8